MLGMDACYPGWRPQGGCQMDLEVRTVRPWAAYSLLAIVSLFFALQLGWVIPQVWAMMTGGPLPAERLFPDETASDRVAATAAEFRVDESGAATYSVPLYGAPGLTST